MENKMVEQARTAVEEARIALQEVGVDPAFLDAAIDYAKKISSLEKAVSATTEVAKACISNLRQEKENLEEEVSYLEQEVTDLRISALRLVETDIEFLDKLINIDINCQDELQKLKELQDVAGRRLTVLRDIELYSR